MNRYILLYTFGIQKNYSELTAGESRLRTKRNSGLKFVLQLKATVQGIVFEEKCVS